jgi:hypothetical protein
LEVSKRVKPREKLTAWETLLAEDEKLAERFRTFGLFRGWDVKDDTDFKRAAEAMAWGDSNAEEDFTEEDMSTLLFNLRYAKFCSDCSDALVAYNAQKRSDTRVCKRLRRLFMNFYP